MMTRGLLALVGGCLLATESPFTVFVAGSLERIGPKDPPGTSREARIQAARNEFEAFQVVVRSGAGGLEDVTLRASDLSGPGNHRIERKDIEIYREHFIEIRTPSPRSGRGAGFVPDALIPLEGPAAPPLPAGKLPRFCAVPFSLEGQTNQPLWVEIHVPRDAAPGEYSGSITVTAASQEPMNVPFTLTVWDFALPDLPSLRTNFGGLGRRLLTGHPGYHPDSPPYRRLERRYAEAMAAHRICPPIPPYLRPKVGPDGTIDPATSPSALKEWIDALHVTGYPVELLGQDPVGKDRDRNVKYLHSLWSYLKQNHWETLAYVPFLEDLAPEEFLRRARLVHEVQPGLKVLYREARNGRDAGASGALSGSVDIWVSPWIDFDEKAVALRLKAGEQVWSCPALPRGTSGDDTPFWQLDSALLDYRIAGWTSRRFGLSGLYYWTMVFWPNTDVWMDPITERPYNDEGVLFYPGVDAGIEGPVPSLRLKALRDGLEDYEYLVLAGDAGIRVAGALAGSWTRWDKDPAKLASAREELARLILARKK